MSQLSPSQAAVDFSQHKVVVVVPSYNEARFLGSVLLRLRCFPVIPIVIDDGSQDDTAAIAECAGVEVIRLEKNQGKGAALCAGFERARQFEPDAIVMIDADGQHLVEELPLVVAPVLAGEADLVVGSRYIERTSSVPQHRVFGHVFFRLLTNITSGVALSDTQSGYRAFSPRAFNRANFQSKGYTVESEMQFLAQDEGLRVKEVPITIRYTDPPRHSVIRHGLIVFNGVLRLTSQYRPLLFFGLPGLFVLAIGFGWGITVVDIYNRSQELAVGYTLITLLLSITGLTLFSTGIILHAVRGLLLDFFSKERRG
jgi:glycosyltransferase involved in cell wall biosynthesis